MYELLTYLFTNSKSPSNRGVGDCCSVSGAIKSTRSQTMGTLYKYMLRVVELVNTEGRLRTICIWKG